MITCLFEKYCKKSQFLIAKSTIFSSKFLIIFLFLLKTLIMSICEAVLTNNHNLCFGAKIRRECKPQFYYMSPVMRKKSFCICENKNADQLRGNREADQRLSFRYIDSTKTQISFAKVISAFVFATRIVQSFNFLNAKLQASSQLV